MNLNTLYNGDCLELMKDIPDKSIDMILTDPPYGINFLSPWTDNHTKILNDSFEDYLNLLEPMFKEYKRILSDNGCCCCCCGGGKTPVSAIFTMKAIEYFHLIQTVIWEKFIGLGWRYRPAYETIVVLSKSKTKYNFYDISKKCSNVIKGINQKIPQKGEHPTQKPVALMEHFIRIHSKENNVILDPFIGSGTTAIACLNTNRNFIGMEKEQKYYDIAMNRIENWHKENNQRLAI